MRKLLLLLSIILGGCTSTSQLFYWGQYEDMIYTQYMNPGDMTAEQQMNILTSDINTALQNNLKPAPGLYAQLGTAAVENGQRNAARQAFQKEATLYPESKSFMEYLIKQLDEGEKK